MVSFAPNILLHYGQSYIQRRKAPNELTKTMTGCCLFFASSGISGGFFIGWSHVPSRINIVHKTLITNEFRCIPQFQTSK
jgi:hypothetical protein